MDKIYHKYGSIVVMFLILYLSFIIIKPYFYAIVSAAIISYIFYPLYKRLHHKTGKENLSAIIMCLFVFIIVIIPSIFILNSLVRQIPTLYGWLSTTMQNSDFWEDVIFKSLYDDFGITVNLHTILQSLGDIILKYIKDILTSLPDRLLNVSVAAFLIYYFFKDGKYIMHKIIEVLPFEKKDSEKLLDELNHMTSAVVYGQILTAVIQATLATIGFYALGIKAPVVWGALTLILATIPVLGPAFIYIPLSLNMMINSFTVDNNFILIKGIILLVYGLGVISTVDNIVKPLLISGKGNMHPIIVMLSVLGGLSLFGILGVVLGPLSMVILITLLKMHGIDLNLFKHKS